MPIMSESDRAVTVSPNIRLSWGRGGRRAKHTGSAQRSSLRAELSLRSLGFVTTHGFLYERSDGQVSSTIFGHGDDGRHGNFHPLAYQKIRRNPRWARRLEKVHTASKRVRVRSNWRRKELDCANSSDALLMNIFCHPELMQCSNIHSVVGIESNAELEFGSRPRTPLHCGRRDNTEVDMRVGDLLVEAKLTESDFQSAKASLVTRYRDIDSVFDLSELPCAMENTTAIN